MEVSYFARNHTRQMASGLPLSRPENRVIHGPTAMSPNPT
jgi:hypothetical protein